MKRRTRIIDLNFDLLKHIMFFVATSSNRPENFARAMCTCKVFRKLAEDSDILKVIVFGDTRPPLSDRSFWKANGLLKRCACAGNLTALKMLLESIIERSGSALTLMITELTQMGIKGGMQVIERFFTRSGTRAILPFWEVIRDIFIDVDVEVEYLEVLEILEQLQDGKLLLHVKQEVALLKSLLQCFEWIFKLPECLGEKGAAPPVVDIISKLKERISSKFPVEIAFNL